jgi:PAS domain S-box-containing protein
MQQQIKNFRRHLQLAFIVPLVLAILLGGVFVLQTYYLRSAMKDVEHSYQLQIHGRSLLRLMLDMETGLRGYLLTGEERFLDPYRISAPQVEPALQDMERLVRSDPQQTLLLQQLRARYGEWHLYSLRLIDQRRAGSPVSDVQVNMRGKAIMDSIRGIRDELLGIEEHRLARRIDRVRRTMTSIFVTAVVLSLFLGLLLATFSRRELQTVGRTYDAALGNSMARAGELKESQRRLGAVLASIGDGVIATDPCGRIVFANDVAQRLLALTHAEIVNRHTTEVLHILDEYSRDAAPDLFREVMYRQDHFSSPAHSLLLRSNATELPVAATASPIRDEGQITGVVIVLRDLTRERQSERSLQSAEKLASIGRLAASVAHEIHNPLDAMGNILYLLEHGPLDETSKTYVRLAREELERVTNISEQMLTFSRESRQPIEVKVADIFENVLTLFSARIRRMDVTIVKQIDPDLTITAFPGELRQVFSNLIGNALDSLTGPGKIVVRNQRSHSWNSEHEPGIRILVFDNGCGIPQEVRPHLMDPFVTSKGEKGTGLGLWVCRNIVEKYQGTLRYRTSTTPGRSGTCFSVFFPSGEQKAVAKETPPAENIPERSTRSG